MTDADDRAQGLSGDHPSEDDLATFAVGALPHDEADRIVAHTRSCAECSSLLVEYSEAAAAVSSLLAEVPPRGELFDRISQQLEGRAPVPISTAKGWRPSIAVWGGLAAAAAAAAIAALAFLAVDGHNDADDAEEQLSRIEDVLEGGRVITMDATGEGQQPAVTLIVSESGDRAIILPGDLPENDAAHTYHLWGIEGDVPTRAGTFDIESGEPVRLDLEDDVLASDAVAISLEESERADQPEGLVFAQGEVTS